MIPQAQAAPGRFDLAAWRAECSRPVKVEAFYDDLRERGLHYGEAFRPTTEIHVGDGCFLLRIDASRVRDEVDHPLHPTIFDAAIQPVLFCAKQARLVVPFSFEEFQYFRRPDTDECYAFGRIVGESEQRLVADVWLTDADGTALAQVRGMALQAIEITPGSEEEIFYEPGWQVAPASEAGENPEGRRVLILADEAERPLADEIAGRLPGAEIASLSAAADLPAAHPGRDHLVLLSPAGTFFDSPALCEKIIAIFQSLGAVSGQKWDVTLVSRRARVVDGDASLGNPAAAPLAAIGLVAQNEFDGVTFRSVDLGEGSPAEDAARILAELAARTKGDIAYRGATRREAVIRPLSASEPPENLVSVSVEEPVALRLAGKARLDSLRFASAERPAPGEGEIEVRVHRAALNQKDLLKAEGRLPAFALENTLSGAELGMEAAGVVTRTGPGSRFAEGDRVVGLLPGAFRTFGLIREEFAAKIPASLDFDAAAIPMAYLTAWRGLVGVANLQPGERVLIHQAAGNVGRAAIQIARWIGAEIFATAGTGEKRDWLRDQGIAHVHSSRDLDFGREIRAATNGEGVDVVFGALEGAALPVGVGLLRFGGRFVDTGKKDIADDRGLPLRAFDRGLTFVAVDIDRLAHERPALGAAMLREILDLFEAGKLNPPATSVHPAREVVAAFERLADENAVGKTLLDFSTGEVERLEESASAPVVRGDGCYVVTGGTSGFGLATGRWLVERGAGEVLLVSRSGPKAPGVAGAVAAMNQAGARVEALALDVTDPAQIAALFARIAAGPRPLRGVIHGAMVMGDAMMTDVTSEDFRRVYATKAGGAAHLAAALEGHKELDFVVFYSSISALIGNRGQTSYVAANAFLDALARDLRARGCPAVSLNWGALAESGVVARDERLGVLLSTAGITGLGDREAFRALERAIRGGKGQLGIFKVDWNKWAEAHAALAEDPRFRELRTSPDAAGGGAAAQIRAALAGASPEERQAALLEHLRATLAETLKMAPDAVSTHQRLNEMGVDSLLVLELSLGIQERIGVSFSAMEFLKGPTLEQLATLAAQKLWRHGPAA